MKRLVMVLGASALSLVAWHASAAQRPGIVHSRAWSGGSTAPAETFVYGVGATVDETLIQSPGAHHQGDPADSLYRLAREALNRGEYRRAAELFHQVSDRFPRSAYVADSGYWEAFARYRIGTTDELRAASAALESLASRPGPLSRDVDVATLRARIDGALAMRGQADAAQRVAREAAQAGSSRCDPDDMMVRAEALNALNQMDQASALPILRRVLDRKDECSADLRRRALFLVARRADTAAASTLMNVARNDPNYSVRSEAVGFLARMPGENVLPFLEELLRTSDDERIQRSAVRALMSSDNPRARLSMRALIERRDAPERLRAEAIGSFERDRGSADDAAYLRALYPKLESERLKEAVIGTVSRIGGKENEAWLVALMKNPNETTQLRSSALSRVGRLNIPVAELGKMYDAADSRNMREQILSVLGNRTEPEATDKLFEIAKSGTDPYARRLAINMLSRKNDPRTTKLLMELIEK